MEMKLTPMPWVVMLCAALTGCASSGSAFGETPGERFRAYMARLDADCRKAGLGPYLASDASPRMRGDASCNLLLLKPRDWSDTKFVRVEGQPLPVPEEWLATEEGRFAHSIKLPDPLPADSGYRPGMTSEEYFKHLCEKEAGEFVYKAAENVEGVLQMRRDVRATHDQLRHLYALEDRFMYGLSAAERSQDYLVQPPIGKYYFLEAQREISKDGDRYIHYSRGKVTENSKVLHLAINGESLNVPYIVVDRGIAEPLSRHAYFWRGVVRPSDRELGIIGGEIVVIDLNTRQVLAVRRRFQRTDNMAVRVPGIQWAGGDHVCPNDVSNSTTLARFLNAVLKPILNPAGAENGK